MDRRRLAWIAGIAALLLLGLWQARPVLVWHLTVLPEIEEAGRSERLDVPTLRDLAYTEPRWARVNAGSISLRAPLADGQEAECRRCSGVCALEIEGGRITFLDGALPDTYERAQMRYAPSPVDVSLLRFAPRNWETVASLASRALLPSAPPESFRFAGPKARAIVSRFDSRGVERFVVYAYPRDTEGGRIFAISRSGPDVLGQVLASIDVGDAPTSARCERTSF